LEEWLKDEKVENTPFVIQADEGVGKKTLLVKWMDHHRKNKIGVNIFSYLYIAKRYQDFIIAHFATTGGNNANYFFAIYRILIKLRVYII
jgi:hypothetical protein